MKRIPSVVIIGRINVGKSALFNRLTETSKAIVSNVAGTTRDYNISQVNWQRKTFNLIDTGGINIDVLKHSIQSLISKKTTKKILNIDSIEKEIIKQTKQALQKADLFLMVVDGQAGLLPEDKELALVVKKLKTPTLLVCNKIDNQKQQHQVNDFFKLGLNEPIPVSAINGSGSGDLLDQVAKKIKGQRGRPAKTVDQPAMKVAIIGKPNTGKSSLVNKILGEERMIVSPVAQTTRESQDTEMEYQGQKIILIDTAGLRKKTKIKPGLEKISTEKTLKVINQADIVLIVTEVQEMLTTQDRHLTSLVKDSRAGIIIIANKWDLVTDKTKKTADQIENYYKKSLPYLTWAPRIFTSAKTGHKIGKILDIVLEVWQEKNKEVTQTDLNRTLKKIVKQKRPVRGKAIRGKLSERPRIVSLNQIKTNPPEFLTTLGKGQSLHFSYLRFIENQLRKNFGFLGVPIIIRVKTLKR